MEKGGVRRERWERRGKEGKRGETRGKGGERRGNEGKGAERKPLGPQSSAVGRLSLPSEPYWV